MATKQQIAESLEHFEALLVLIVSSDASNEKAIELAKSVHKKHHILFWSKINLSKSNFVFDVLDGDEDEFFDVNTQTQSQQDPNQTENADKAENAENAGRNLEKEDPRGGPSNAPTVASSGASVALFEDPFKTPGPKDGSKSVKNSQKSTKNAKICPRLTNRGEICDKKSDCQAQFSHPSRCRHFVKFGNVSDFPKGEGCSWEVKCRFAHVKVCKKTTCPKVDCNLTHLQPKPKTVLPSRNQSGSQANHKRVQQRSNQDHVPCAAGSLEKNSAYSSSGQGSKSIINNNNKSERSFLEPGLQQRLSRLEGMLEELMMTLIPNQQGGFPTMALNNINNNSQQNQVSHPLWRWRQ
jgi:hypothetical protein